MQLDPTQLGIRDFYLHMVRLITPRPIAWVSTVSPEGVTNLAPYSFFNGVGANPPSVVFCPVNRRDGSKKDSLLNIEKNGEFVVNVVSFDLAEKMNQTSADYPAEVSEFQACGLTELASERVKPPRLGESAAQFECTLMQAIQLGTGPAGSNVVIGRIELLHINDDVLDEEGYADAAKLDNVGRLGGASYTRTTERFDLPRPKI
jgi:flavin reductase (DIM6/NTAB) family NADH-FMN oxidoreductase RutF